MKIIYEFKSRYSYNLITLVLILFMLGCTQIRLISDYDEETDKGITSLQKNVNTLLISLERTAGTEEGLYYNYLEKYDEIKSDLVSLQIRNEARPKNEITIAQLENLMSQVINLEELHKENISADEIEPLRNAFNQSFKAILTLELAKKRGDEGD